MYRVIIVDDELLIRIAYQSIVDWKEYEFELVGMFENGQEALDAFEDLLPDLVLTDTKMPVCDGIQLIRGIKERAPETICIILSAYGDLDYVKEGMRAGAEDYLLKLDITPERFGQLLSASADKLKMLKHSRVESVSGDIQKRRQEFLRSWIRGEFSERETILDYLRFYKIKFRTRQMICMSIRIESERILTDEMTAVAQQTATQVLQSTGTWVVVDMQSNHLCVVGCCDDASMEKYGESVQKSILFALKSVMNLSDVVVQWSTCRDVLVVPKIFARLVPQETQDETTLVEVQELVNSLLHFQYEEVIRRLQVLSSLFSAMPFSSMKLMRNNCAYILMSLKTAMKGDPLLEEWIRERYPEMKAQLSECYTPRDLTQWVEQFCVTLEEMRQNRAPAASLTQRAETYLKEHFTEDLSLDYIAEHCGVSPTYLSRIFAQEKRKGVLEYLTDLRIYEAKRLLAETNEKVYEVAAKSGYPDAVYFSKVFKKNTGVTPKEYRRKKYMIKDKK